MNKTLVMETEDAFGVHYSPHGNLTFGREVRVPKIHVQFWAS